MNSIIKLILSIIFLLLHLYFKGKIIIAMSLITIILFISTILEEINYNNIINTIFNVSLTSLVLAVLLMFDK
jgi:hypothetical protein